MDKDKILAINRNEVQKLLPMDVAIDVMAEALKLLAKEQVVMPRRMVMWLPQNIGALGLMPSYSVGSRVFGLKAISVFPENPKLGYDSHQGVVLLFDSKNGRLLAIIDASEITAIRTAAASALATKLLSRKDAANLVILGSGVQARKHLEAMRQVRKINQVAVWNPSPDSVHRFVESESVHCGMKIEAQASRRPDLSEAEIICTVTSSLKPVLLGKSIPKGAHINAVGASQPNARELDTEAVARSRLYVDSRESVLNESGDFLVPKNKGAIDDKHIVGEIGELLLGRIEGRSSENDITLFNSLGLAIEDVAAAAFVYQQAIEKKIGAYVEL